MTKELTPKQKTVLKFIRERIQENLPPTIREIAEHMGFSSTGTVRDYLEALEKKGYLKRNNNLSRSMSLLKETPNRMIPILAEIPAGKPNLTHEHIQGYIDPDELFLGRLSQNDVFALKVKGDSMVEAGIMEGDIAVFKKQSTADNGSIVAALMENNEVTLKRLRRKQENNTFFLEPANSRYQPIQKEFSVIGKLLTIIRKY